MGIDVNPETCSSFTKVWTHTWLFTVCFSYVALCEVLPELIITLQLLRVTERDVRRRPQRALSPTKGPLAQLPNLSWLFGANQPSPWGPCDVMCCQSDVGSSPALLSFVICGPHYRAAGLWSTETWRGGKRAILREFLDWFILQQHDRKSTEIYDIG